MGDKVIITEDEDKSAKPEIVVVVPETKAKTETVVTEKATVIETRAQ